jgi:Phenylalanyl-tRNA synthetase alpha subunit
MDVAVDINGKEVELGGSGIFRPEVTKPMGLKEPVLAFGLGLERLAMLYYNFNDIREIYNSDLDWLKNYKIRF